MTFPTDLKWFKASEFTEPDKMNLVFVWWLDLVRNRCGIPFIITSSYRDGDKGLHGKGMAIDIRTMNWNAAQKWLVMEAIVFYADQAPGKVELEMVFSPVDKHWHIGVDPRTTQQHELIEMDD